MNIAIIFAGGTGQRMNSKTKPKQFLELYGKPILVYTLEQFQNHEKIDEIILVCLEEWISYSENLIKKYGLSKVRIVLKGGRTGQESIFNGVSKAYEIYGKESIVLIHDGVRPLIDSETISKNIETVEKFGSAVTVTPAIETITMSDCEGKICSIIDRKSCCLARAPQSFYLSELYNAHKKNQSGDNNEFIDSASLMRFWGKELYTVEGKPENIKITTSSDFYMFRAMIDARENSQIFG